MKKIIFLLLPLMLLFSCSEQKTKADTIKLSDELATKLKKKLSWEAYHKYCGEQNLKAPDNFEKLKGTVVTWKGEFSTYTVPKQPTALLPELKVKMPNGGGVLSDVTLRVNGENRKIAEKLKIGDEILFKGKIMYLGSGMGDHVLILERLKYLPPQEPKKVVR